MRQRAQVWCRFWLALGVVLVASGAFAQALPPTAETDFQPNRDYLALLPWESIDTASGNLGGGGVVFDLDGPDEDKGRGSELRLV